MSIFVDGKYSFSLSLDELLNEKLKNNDELDESRLARLKKISSDGKLRMRAMEWVLNRPRSVREFQDYLRRKKTDPELSHRLTEEFLQKNYLNEESFAGWLAEFRSRSGKSNRAIRAELFKKGIPNEIIEAVLSEETISEEERIKQIIAKKIKLTRYRSDPQKLMRYLASQGFSYSLIKESLIDSDIE